VTVEVDLSTPSGSGRAADAPDAPGPSDAPSGMERVTVSPLTAEAVNGPDGSDLESSFMVNTGEGLAWTMDWSPVDPTDGSSLLAVGCHPPGSSDSLHELTELCTKKDAVIQIWRVSGAGREGKVEPLVNLVHEGGVTWSVCWCPTPQALNGRMGLLAAVLGDGTVCVWDVPKLDPPGEVGGSGVRQPQLTCRAAPVAKIGPASVDGSIPCTVDWLPHEPFDLLLVGYRDGCVSIVQLADEASDRMHIKQYFPAEALTLTAAKWFPSELHDGHKEVDDGAERRTFVTCGQESAINVWDTRMEFTPKISIKTACAYSIHDMTFSKSPLGISVAMEDGAVRSTLLGAADISSQLKSGRPLSLLTFKGNGLHGGLWAIDAGQPSVFSNGEQSIAYAGEDGIVGMMGNASYPYLAKKRKSSDTPVRTNSAGAADASVFVSQSFRILSHCGSSFAQVLRLEVSGDSESTFRLSSGDKVPPGTLYSDSKSVLVKDVIPNAAHTIYCMRWCKRAAGEGASRGQWLAYGNASGIVHVVWVKAHKKEKEKEKEKAKETKANGKPKPKPREKTTKEKTTKSKAAPTKKAGKGNGKEKDKDKNKNKNKREQAEDAEMADGSDSEKTVDDN